jgi:hypothetical protein
VSIEEAIRLLEKKQRGRRSYAEDCVRLYLRLLSDPNADPAMLAEAANECGFDAEAMREHRAKLIEFGKIDNGE